MGYDVVQRRLVVNEKEAALVRQIFERFLQHGCYVRLVGELAAEGHTTKSWITQDGKQRVGGRIDKQFVHKLLRNRVYLGETVHKDKVFPGQHQAIVPQPLWDKVHAILATNPTARGNGARAALAGNGPAPLRGLLYSVEGWPMYATHTRRRGKLYRYYLAKADKKFGHGSSEKRMIPAREIEDVVIAQVKQLLASPEWALAVHQQAQRTYPSIDEAQVLMALKRLEAVWGQLFDEERNRLLQLLIERVQLREAGLDIVWRDGGFVDLIEELADQPLMREQREAAAA